MKFSRLGYTLLLCLATVFPAAAQTFTIDPAWSEVSFNVSTSA